MQQLRDRQGDRLADAEAVLRGSHQRITRVSVLDDDQRPVSGLVFTDARDQAYILDGNVSMDIGRAVQRTLSLSVANPAGIWTPRDFTSAFYWNRMVKVERGVRSGGVDYWATMGVFVLDTPSVDSRSATLDITGADRMDRATRSKFTAPTTYAAGTRVGAVIRDILEDAGVGSYKWQVDDDGQTLGKKRVYEVEDGRLEAALKLAKSFGLDVFASAAGFMVVEPHRKFGDVEVSWRFRAGPDATHLNVQAEWSRERFYNHVLVIGENAKQQPVRAEAKITGANNPLRVTGPMGDSLFTYKSGMITTQAQAQRSADALLDKHALIEENVSVQFVPNPMLEAGDAVRIVDEVTLVEQKYIIRSMDIPLAGGTSNLKVSKVESLL